MCLHWSCGFQNICALLLQWHPLQEGTGWLPRSIFPDEFDLAPGLKVGTPVGETQRRLWYYLYDDHFDAPADFQTDIHPALLITSQVQSTVQPQGLSITLLSFSTTLGAVDAPEGKQQGLPKWCHAGNQIQHQFWMKVPALTKTQNGKERVSSYNGILVGVWPRRRVKGPGHPMRALPAGHTSLGFKALIWVFVC